MTFLFLFSKIGEEQSAEDAEDGPPELLVSTDESIQNIIVNNRNW